MNCNFCGLEIGYWSGGDEACDCHDEEETQMFQHIGDVDDDYEEDDDE